MKCYKFISETQIEEYNKNYVVVDSKQISHPSPETLLKAGIKPLIEEEEPTYNPDTQATEYYFEDGETEIYKKWRIVEVSEDELADA